MALPTSNNTVNVTRLGSILSTLWGKIKTALGNKSDKTEIANTYSASATYNIGDLVYYSGVLYTCTTAITTAEEWNSEHWNTTTVEGAIANNGKGFVEVTTSNTYAEVTAILNAGKIPYIKMSSTEAGYPPTLYLIFAGRSSNPSGAFYYF